MTSGLTSRNGVRNENYLNLKAVTLEPRPFPRADGPDKVTGTGRYAADMVLPGMAFARFKYAEISHARIVRLDTSKAESLPGVLAVITATDVPDVRYSPGVADRTLFATDAVRFEGEILAAVAATTEALAQAAVDAIEVEYEQLPTVTDVVQAIAPGAPLVHPDWQNYEVSAETEQRPNVASFSSIAHGDAEAGMARAATVVTSRYVADASHASPIEPRAILAQWEGRKLTVWSATQVPFDARAGVCETLDLPTNQVRIIVPHLGGGFGGKCGFHFEAHIAALARAAGRPVKLVFSRKEEFLAPDRRREGMVVELTTGLNADGTIAARTGTLLIDNGAYTADAAFFPQLAAMLAAGPYRIPALKIEASLVYTNHQPSGSVRAPTAPQACWAIESHTDELAATVGMAPVEFRRLNGLRSGDVGPVGQTYGEIGLQACIDSVASRLTGETGTEADEAIGLAVGWWPSFPGPSGAYIKIDSDGAGQIITGAQECGTGAVMTLRQLAADELGMAAEDFELVYQDTGVAPYDTGATGSQTLFNNGRAVLLAASELADQIRQLAADHLEAAPSDIVLSDGHASVAGSPNPAVSVAELAATAAGAELLIAHGSGKPGEYPETVGASCVGDQGVAAWASPQFSCHGVRVRLDSETGVVRVLNVATCHDSGTILNPLGALGQVEGGVLMGIGQALTEGTQYDEDGCQRNPGLLEYKLQTAADAPTITTQFVETTGGQGPHGAKGLAEAPNVATAAAISNALAKLIGSHVTQLPMTPERVWATMTDVTPSDADRDATGHDTSEPKSGDEL